MRLLACPICGKYPEIVEHFSDEAIIECRPKGYFGIRKNAHLIVFGKSLLDAVRVWNEEVEKFYES